MPLLTGLESAAAWRREEKGPRMPIILLTADAMVLDREENRSDVDLIRIKLIIPSDLIRDVGQLAGAEGSLQAGLIAENGLKT